MSYRIASANGSGTTATPRDHFDDSRIDLVNRRDRFGTNATIPQFSERPIRDDPQYLTDRDHDECREFLFTFDAESREYVKISVSLCLRGPSSVNSAPNQLTALSVISSPRSMIPNASRSCSSVMMSGGFVKK